MVLLHFVLRYARPLPHFHLASVATSIRTCYFTTLYFRTTQCYSCIRCYRILVISLRRLRVHTLEYGHIDICASCACGCYIAWLWNGTNRCVLHVCTVVNGCRTSSFRRGGCLILRWGKLTLVVAPATPTSPWNAVLYRPRPLTHAGAGAERGHSFYNRSCMLQCDCAGLALHVDAHRPACGM